MVGSPNRLNSPRPYTPPSSSATSVLKNTRPMTPISRQAVAVRSFTLSRFCEGPLTTRHSFAPSFERSLLRHPIKSATPLAATLVEMPANGDSKRFTETLSPLDATLAENAGGLSSASCRLSRCPYTQETPQPLSAQPLPHSVRTQRRVGVHGHSVRRLWSAGAQLPLFCLPTSKRSTHPCFNTRIRHASKL